MIREEPELLTDIRDFEVIYEMFHVLFHILNREVTGSNPVEVLTFSGFRSQLLKLRSKLR